MSARFWPLARGTFRVGSPFGPREGGFHAGQDFAADDGTPFYAVADGTVQFIGPAGGYGQWIVLDHPAEVGGGCSEYGHMWNAYATGLSVGDRVRGGQLLGYVGSNGQSTGPHLHLSVMPYGYDPNAKIDPMPWLDGAHYPGEGNVPGIPDSSGGNVGTVFGIDVSNHQGNFDFAAARAEGFTFATHKINEGTWRDPYWGRALDEMRQHFPGRFGGYVFCKIGTSPDAEADVVAAMCPTDVPIQIDYEDLDRNGSIGDLWARINALTARGFRLLPIYLPRWYWSGRMGSPDLSGLPVKIWNSHYVTGTGFASSLYPGDLHPGWAPMGGKDVAILQFTEQASVAGQRIDANAVRGGEAKLAELFGGGEELNMNADELKAIVYECLQTYVGPIGSDVKDIREQVTGGRDAGEYGGFEQGGNRTLYDLNAATAAKDGVPGCRDTLAPNDEEKDA